MSQARFGIWALVHGSRGALHDPDEPFDASWARNKNLVLEAEALGYDSVLIAQHTANPYDDEWDELEAWTAAAGLAALTSRIEIIAADRAYFQRAVRPEPGERLESPGIRKGRHTVCRA